MRFLGHIAASALSHVMLKADLIFYTFPAQNVGPCFTPMHGETPPRGRARRLMVALVCLTLGTPTDLAVSLGHAVLICINCIAHFPRRSSSISAAAFIEYHHVRSHSLFLDLLALYRRPCADVATLFPQPIAAFLDPKNKDGEDTLLTSDELYHNFVRCDVNVKTA